QSFTIVGIHSYRIPRIFREPQLNSLRLHCPQSLHHVVWEENSIKTRTLHVTRANSLRRREPIRLRINIQRLTIMMDPSLHIGPLLLQSIQCLIELRLRYYQRRIRCRSRMQVIQYTSNLLNITRINRNERINCLTITKTIEPTLSDHEF